MIAPVVETPPPGAVVVDVRWYLDGTDGRAAYQAGHLPGAVWADLDTQLAAHDRPATEGRHPFPSAQAFAAAMGALGIGDDTVVVAYDDSGGLTAGRLVVMLRMIGHDAALLDGGLAAWTAAGNPVESGPGRTPEPAAFTPVQWPTTRLATADDALVHAANGGAVLDARAPERFTGEVILVDPRPGHVPGAERPVGRGAGHGRPAAAPCRTARPLRRTRRHPREQRRGGGLLRLGRQRMRQPGGDGARRHRPSPLVRGQLVRLVGRPRPPRRARPGGHHRMNTVG